MTEFLSICVLLDIDAHDSLNKQQGNMNNSITQTHMHKHTLAQTHTHTQRACALRALTDTLHPQRSTLHLSCSPYTRDRAETERVPITAAHWSVRGHRRTSWDGGRINREVLYSTKTTA